MANLPLETNESNGKSTPNPARVRWLREQISELRKRWPPHSAPPGLLLRLDDLEEELNHELQKGSGQEGKDQPTGL